jgi:hypothetical protein
MQVAVWLGRESRMHRHTLVLTAGANILGNKIVDEIGGFLKNLCHKRNILSECNIPYKLIYYIRFKPLFQFPICELSDFFIPFWK